MWNELWMALGLMLVLEGLLPALNPDGFRRMVEQLRGLNNRFLRGWGLFCIISGALIVHFARG